jgi:LAO/AO transport system kinase
VASRPSVAPDAIDALIAQAVEGGRAALARLLSEIERGGETAERIDAVLSRRPASSSTPACTIGITGAPGAGKSTLLGALLAHLGDRGERVAALMVDPSSPLTGGALLGDRLRMSAVDARPGVYARSMASRGRSGGLSDMTRRAVRVLGACGWPTVFIETVGIGQLDVDVSTVADLVVVVLTPGAGDDVQMFKAGLMEIADVFVINKADHPQVGALRQDLAGMIASIPDGRPRPAVVETIATQGVGVTALWDALAHALSDRVRSGELSRVRAHRVAREIVDVASGIMTRRLRERSTGTLMERLMLDVIEGRQAVGEAAVHLLSTCGVDVTGTGAATDDTTGAATGPASAHAKGTE